MTCILNIEEKVGFVQKTVNMHHLKTYIDDEGDITVAKSISILTSSCLVRQKK